MSRPAEAICAPPPPGAPRRAGRVAGTLLLGTAALVLGLLAALPWLAHARAAGWPVVTAEVIGRRVLTQSVNGKGPSYVVRDSYRVPGPNGPASCHWDDPLGTGIRRWVDARLETRERYWPVGSQAPVRAEPYGDRCEPLGGFERAVRPTAAVVALAALACLCGLALLWRRPAPVR
ncbi:MAG TPA: hypothetical protein VMU00_04155 [Steroidobacteraceae bacterium]|nr:hypothetical protein [Steroidobacteraceae bacterium]